MTVMVKRWYRSRRNQLVLVIAISLCAIYYFFFAEPYSPRLASLDLTRRQSVLKYIESKLEEALKDDKGMGCKIPQLDPFAKEIVQFDKFVPSINCPGTDWVKCYHSNCRVVPEVLSTTKNIECKYSDIIYFNDSVYHIGSATVVKDDGVYTLTRSDHVKIACSGVQRIRSSNLKWTGLGAGFRTTVERKPSPPGREENYNVLIFGFDSTSKNAFIRRLPKSYKYLTEVMKAVVLNGYNIVGDGTPAALIPILTGTTELELPDVRKNMNNKQTCDIMPFIFYKLKDDGYRTAYFEDMPWIGTFQYRFNGFRHQPADHYLRPFFLEDAAMAKVWPLHPNKYCVGDQPRFKLMMNLTDQFLRLDGKKYIFSFIADITHDDNNQIMNADDGTRDLLQSLVESGALEDTMILVMGDHGNRFASARNTFQGKLEERLPMMSISLPLRFQRERPRALSALRRNVAALSTPHDIYATVLDVLGWRRHWNTYRVAGADLPRGVTLLEPIPRNRSCSEAGIEPHWCSCLHWQNVSEDDHIYLKAGHAFVDYINFLTKTVRGQCIPRVLTRVWWAMRLRANTQMLKFAGARDHDGYVGNFNGHVKVASETYQLKVEVSPGQGLYEVSMKYFVKEDKFLIDTRDISRINAYNDEPSCISAKHPHLNSYCYCRNYMKHHD